MKKIKKSMLIILSTFTLVFVLLYFSSCAQPSNSNTNENTSKSDNISQNDNGTLLKSITPNGSGQVEFFWEAEANVTAASGVRYETHPNASGSSHQTLHFGSDSQNPPAGNGDYITYQVTISQAFSNGIFEVRYCDNVGGNVIEVYLDGSKKGQFTTETNSDANWNTFTWDNEVIKLGAISAGSHIFTLKVTNGGSWGVNLDEYGIYDLDSNISAYWKFNEDSNTDNKVNDSSGNNNNGSINANYQRNGGVDGKALYFNGSTYVNIANMNNFPDTLHNASYTIEAWVRPDTMATDRGIIRWGADGSHSQVSLKLMDWTTTGGIKGIQHDWGGAIGGTAYPCNLVGGWHHVASTYDGTTIKTYLDGNYISTYQSSSPLPSLTAPLQSLTIGRGIPSYGEYFQGLIDELVVWKKCLSSTEVKNRYNFSSANNQTTTSANLLIKYLFNEGSGATVADQSTYGNTGTLSGATWVNWSEGSGLTFDGIDDCVNFTYAPGRPSNNFTLEAWVKAIDTHEIDTENNSDCGGTSGQKWIFGATHGGDYDGGVGVSVGTNGISVYEHGSGYMPALAVYNGNVGKNWSHIVVTYTDQVPRIYLNGNLIRTGIKSARRYSYAPIQLGKGPYGAFKGLVDDVLIYNKPLSADEVLQHYNQSIHQNPSQAIGVFYMNDNSTSSISDLSGNGYTGTVNGATPIVSQGVGGSNTYQFSWASQSKISIGYNSAQAATSALTVEAWIYPTAWDNVNFGYNRIVSKQPIYLIRGASNGYSNFVVNTTNYGFQSVSGAFMTLNQWHYIVGSFDGRYIKLYLDGVLQGTITLPANDTLQNNANPIYIGESQGLNEGFTGKVDNVAIFKRAKTATEIQQTYNLLK